MQVEIHQVLMLRLQKQPQMINKIFPVLNTLDGWLALLLPFAFRLMIWGALAGALSIIIYAALSPQDSIKRLKKKIRSLQREMLGLDLEFPDFLRLSKENLKTSLRLFVIVLGPGLVSVLPVLTLVIWLHTCLAYEAPEALGDLVTMSADENIDLSLSTLNNSNRLSEDEILKNGSVSSPTVVVMADGKVVYSGDPLSPPTRVIYKRRWWNVLLESPAGYVVDDAPIESIKLNISRKQVVKWGPNWARGWEFTFFVFVFIAALGIKLGFRIA